MNSLNFDNADIIRFNRFIVRVDGHSIWMGARTQAGYGTFRKRCPRETVLAHRVVWILANGDISEGMIVHHICEIKPCVDLLHLTLCTESWHRLQHVNNNAGNVCINGHSREIFGTKWKRGNSFKIGCRRCARDKWRERSGKWPKKNEVNEVI